MKKVTQVLLILLVVAMLLCTFGCSSNDEKNPSADSGMETTTKRTAVTDEYTEYLQSFEVQRYSPERDFEIAVPESDPNGYFCLSCGEEMIDSQVHDLYLQFLHAHFALNIPTNHHNYLQIFSVIILNIKSCHHQ